MSLRLCVLVLASVFAVACQGRPHPGRRDATKQPLAVSVSARAERPRITLLWPGRTPLTLSANKGRLQADGTIVLKQVRATYEGRHIAASSARIAPRGKRAVFAHWTVKSRHVSLHGRQLEIDVESGRLVGLDTRGVLLR